MLREFTDHFHADEQRDLRQLRIIGVLSWVVGLAIVAGLIDLWI